MGFDPAVLAEAGLVTSTSSLYLRCRLLLPIREEEGRKRGRSIDAAAETDVALSLGEPKSKKFCRWANKASEEANRRGKKRKWNTTAIAENDADAALGHKSKRARIWTAGASHVQGEVVEVSRFIVIACSLFLFHSCVYFLHPNLICLIVRSIPYHHVS